MSRLLARVLVARRSDPEPMVLSVRRRDSEILLSLAGSTGTPLSLWYAVPTGGQPVFAAGSDAAAVASVLAWLRAGGAVVRSVESAPAPPAPAAGDPVAELRAAAAAARAAALRLPPDGAGRTWVLVALAELDKAVAAAGAPPEPLLPAPAPVRRRSRRAGVAG